MNAFTIKDLENLTGIKAHTIRIWEQRYTFLKPQRTDTNIRYYSNDELKMILNIALLNKYGFKISHIDRMSPDEIKQKTFSLVNTQAQQERVINELIQYMIDLNLDQFEVVLDNYISIKGVERTIINIIFPFMERIGILWITNHINPAQEHLVTNIIRQKLIVGIESANPHIRLERTAMLFLPEGEHHELGLLFMYFLLKTRGIQVLYLGASVPMADLQYIVQLKKPNAIYTHLSSVASNFNLEKFLNSVGSRFSGTNVVISGQIIKTYKKALPENVHVKKTLQEVLETITVL